MQAAANTPAGRMRLVRSCFLIRFGLPTSVGGASPALYVSRPAQRSLPLRPACSPGRQSPPLHRRLRRLRCLHGRFDCYRVERTSSRAGLAPAMDQRLFTAHNTVVLSEALTKGSIGGGHTRTSISRSLVSKWLVDSRFLPQRFPPAMRACPGSDRRPLRSGTENSKLLWKLKK